MDIREKFHIHTIFSSPAPKNPMSVQEELDQTKKENEGYRNAFNRQWAKSVWDRLYQANWTEGQHIDILANLLKPNDRNLNYKLIVENIHKDKQIEPTHVVAEDILLPFREKIAKLETELQTNKGNTMLLDEFNTNPELMIAVQTDLVEEPVSRIQSLSDQIFELQDELQTEYLLMFRNDEDLKDSLASLDEHGTLRYTHKGLLRSVPFEFNEFDEIAGDALDDFASEQNFIADTTLGYVSKKLDNYLLYVDHGVSSNMVRCENGVEQVIPITRSTRTASQIKDLLQETAMCSNFNGLVVSCDEFGNVTVVE